MVLKYINLETYTMSLKIKSLILISCLYTVEWCSIQDTRYDNFLATFVIMLWYDVRPIWRGDLSHFVW